MAHWYAGREACLVEYELPFTDKEDEDDLRELRGMVAQDAAFSFFLKRNNAEHDFLAKNVDKCIQDSYDGMFLGCIWESSGKLYKIQHGLLNYCEFTVKQYDRYKKHSHLISPKEERERVKKEVRHYLSVALELAAPFWKTSPQLNYWYQAVEKALFEDIDIQLLTIEDDDDCHKPANISNISKAL